MISGLAQPGFAGLRLFAGGRRSAFLTDWWLCFFGAQFEACRK